MAKGVAFTDQAKADIRALPQPIALQILRTISRFLESEQGDVKRLQGIEPPEFRLRLGDYRVRFHDLGDSIQILHVRHRKDAYR
jgi:mRNA-degrading endonuclease RelE of RelBE toxin-antitoxin system